MTYTRSGTGGQATKFGMDFVSCLTTEQKTFLSRVVEVGGLGEERYTTKVCKLHDARVVRE